MVCLKQLSLTAAVVSSLAQITIAAPVAVFENDAALAERDFNRATAPKKVHLMRRSPVGFTHMAKVAQRNYEDTFQERDSEDDLDDRSFEDELEARDVSGRLENLSKLFNLGTKLTNLIAAKRDMGDDLEERDTSRRLENVAKLFNLGTKLTNLIATKPEVEARAVRFPKLPSSQRVGEGFSVLDSAMDFGDNLKKVIMAKMGKRDLEELEKRAFEDLVRELYF
ncbi:unnamed protein product [Clonostachys rosea f. rosea IK726]|jgi:hypothetical protein|uniref:Uncharacterized protein n=1 Tax=Clonostachys rosea f. rosea IK726 TaxID=1349383 RepID=A0ACA9UUL8_BIOOC|nr:unnamed protein product [Clonostachys rosea f. rosea IK726]